MNFRYFAHLLRHKWRVMVIGRRLGVPVWQLVVHDWSKFTPSEWEPYATRFEYGTEDERWYRASLAHIHRNPHHWEHWIHVDAGGQTHAVEIPERFAREMLVDWIAASQDNDVRVWYAQRRDLIVLHLATRELIDGWMERNQHVTQTGSQ